MSNALQITADGLGNIDVYFDKLQAAVFWPKMADMIGAEVESQTRRRIHSEKTSPDGSSWVPWSEAYAGTRTTGERKNRKGKVIQTGHSLLESSGSLMDSIMYEVGDEQVTIGTNLPYAAAHQFGVPKGYSAKAPWMQIPQRKYLGLSDDNLGAIDKLIEKFLGEI